jgi:hypothetical protein
MLAKRATLALLAVRALSTLASPMEPFLVPDSDHHVGLDSICDNSESTGAPDGSPEVHLDDAVFVGKREGLTDQYLGIPFALPP